MAANACESTGTTYIYVILVDGVISKDGFFEEDDKEEAIQVAKRYQTYYNVNVKRVRSYRPLSPKG